MGIKVNIPGSSHICEVLEFLVDKNGDPIGASFKGRDSDVIFSAVATDSNGNLIGIAIDDTSQALTYDTSGNLATVTATNAYFSYLLTYAYNTDGSLNTETLTVNNTNYVRNYTYNTSGQLTAVSAWRKS